MQLFVIYINCIMCDLRLAVLGLCSACLRHMFLSLSWLWWQEKLRLSCSLFYPLSPKRPNDQGLSWSLADWTGIFFNSLFLQLSLSSHFFCFWFSVIASHSLLFCFFPFSFSHTSSGWIKTRMALSAWEIHLCCQSTHASQSQMMKHVHTSKLFLLWQKETMC